MFRFVRQSLGSLWIQLRRVTLLGSTLWAFVFLAAISCYAPWFPLLVGAIWIIGRKKNPKVGDTHGSSRWASYLDLLWSGCLQRQGCLTLGKALNCGPPPLSMALWALFTYGPRRSREAVQLMDARLRRPPPQSVFLPDPGPPHLAVFGASGSGKTTAFAVPNLLQDASNAVVLDPKGELYRLTGKHRQNQFGHQVVVIDPFQIASKRADRFNPLTLGRGDPRMLVDNARRLANALVVRTPHEKEPFWNSSAQVLIQLVIAFLMSETKPEEAHLNRLRDLTTNPKVMRELLEYLEKSDACHGLLKRLAGNVRWYQGQTENSIYSVANTHLEFLDSVPVAETLSTTTFDPGRLLTGKMTIYLVLPVDRLQELRGLQRIMVTSLINLLFQAGECRARRVRFYLDEMASMGEVDAIYNALVFGRSFGMRLMFLYQGTGQIAQCFPENKAHDFRATVASVFCGVNDYETAKEVSQWIGQTTVLGHSSQTSHNWGSSTNHGGHDTSQGSNYGYSRSETINEVGRALIQPEEVLQLPPSAAIALLPNVPPILLQKTPYYRRFNTSVLGALWRESGRLCETMVCGGLLLIGWACTLGREQPLVQRGYAQLRTALFAVEKKLDQLDEQARQEQTQPKSARKTRRRTARRR